MDRNAVAGKHLLCAEREIGRAIGRGGLDENVAAALDQMLALMGGEYEALRSRRFGLDV